MDRDGGRIEPTSGGRSACLLGDGDLLRALGLGGIRALVMARADSPLARSRFVESRFAVVDAFAEPERFVDTLVRVGHGRPEPPVLFYQFDRHLLAISRHRDVLAPLFRFHLPPAALVEDLVDKVRFQDLATRLSLPVPSGTTLGRERTDRQPAPAAFPLVAKPAARDDRWAAVEGSAKAVLVETASELEDRRRRWQAAGLCILIQEHIPGDERRIESYHAYVTRDGVALGEFTGRKVRTRPRRFGHTTALEITAAQDVLELGRVIRRRLGLTGVMKMDVKRTPDGSLRLLEINPRFNLWHHAGAVAGVNLPALAYADLTGQPVTPRGPASPGVRWCKRSDVLAARDEGIGFASWLRWAAGCRAWSGIAIDDPVPVLATAVHKLEAMRPGASR